MKNIGAVALVASTTLILGLMVGILIGRFADNHTVTVLNDYSTNKTSTQCETIYKSDTAGKININTASAKELAMLPGIGKTYAERIVAHRLKYGPFVSVDELTNVEGIGNKRLESIRQYITVGG